MDTLENPRSAQLQLFDSDRDREQNGLSVSLLTPSWPEQDGGARIAYIDSNSLLTPASGFMSRYKFTLNPYSGCRFACEYCYARFFAPTLDEQESWGDWVKVKRNSIALIRRACNSRAQGRRLEIGDAIYMSSATDPYQPIERKLGLTSSILKELVPLQPRLTIQTRSPIVVRDVDLLRQFRHIRVNFTVTTDSEQTRLRYEPHCPSIEARLKAARAVSDAGIPIGISISPMLPITDAHSFASRLAMLNAAEYVTQHFKPARSRFSAGSTSRSIQRLEQDHWTKRDYEAVRSILAEALGANRPLLEGTEGYAPP